MIFGKNGVGGNCCQQLFEGNVGRSPFGKIVSSGFYDGTTSGIAQCSACSRWFAYGMVAWDSDQDMRVYSMATLATDAAEEIVKLLSEFGPPNWEPFWWPELPKGTAERTSLFAAMDVELAKAEAPSHVVATKHFTGGILAARALTPSVSDKALLKGSPNYPGPQDWDFWKTYMADCLSKLEKVKG